MVTEVSHAGAQHGAALGGRRRAHGRSPGSRPCRRVSLSTLATPKPYTLLTLTPLPNSKPQPANPNTLNHPSVLTVNARAAGASLDLRNAASASALHLAAAKSHPAVVRALLAAGADRSLRDAQGSTAADLASDNATRAAFR